MWPLRARQGPEVRENTRLFSLGGRSLLGEWGEAGGAGSKGLAPLKTGRRCRHLTEGKMGAAGLGREDLFLGESLRCL